MQVISCKCLKFVHGGYLLLVTRDCRRSHGGEEVSRLDLEEHWASSNLEG